MNQLKFKSITHKRAYYQNERFKNVPGYKKVILDEEPEKEVLNSSDKRMIQQIVEHVAHHDFNEQKNEICDKIPFLTNDITPLNVFKHVKNVRKAFKNIPLSKLVLTLCQSAIENCGVEIKNQNLITVNRLMICVKYPITIDQSNNIPELNWNVNVIENPMFIEVEITDPILYYLVDKYAEKAVRPSTTKDIYLLSSDIHEEQKIIEAKLIEFLFYEVGKTAFVSSLLNRSQDLAGLTDVPGYYFGFGTYVLKGKKTTQMYRTLVGKDLLHVVPLWENIFPFSYSYELTSLDIKYRYNTDSKLCHFTELKNYYVEQVNQSCQRAEIVCTRVTLDATMSDLDPIVVYKANVNVRNKISSHLDDKERFDVVKSKIFPNVRVGAVTKLVGLQHELLNFKNKKVIDLGAAPGTWTKHFINSKVKHLTSVTRNSNPVDLKMDKGVMKLISESKNVNFVYADILTYLTTINEKFDVIASDAATAKANYYTQSIDHNHLAIPVLKSFTNLEQDGYLICKIFDLTDEIIAQLCEMRPYFEQIKIVKPYGSCPTNNEKYIICQKYTSTPLRVDLKRFVYDTIMTGLHLIYGQMSALHRLIKEGYNQTVNYTPVYLASQIRTENVRSFPKQVHLMLNQMKFSAKLFSDHTTGVLTHEITKLGDKILRFQWDTPEIPLPDMIYVQETSIIYGSKDLYLPDPFIFHTGFILQKGVRKLFLYLDKNVSRVFHDRHEDIFITNELIEHIKEAQITFSDLKDSQLYQSGFKQFTNYSDFVHAFRYLSTKYVLELTETEGCMGLFHVLNQFFREVENINVICTSEDDQSITTKSTKRRTPDQLDLQLFSHQKIFSALYTEAQNAGRTLRQTFKDILNQYSIKISYSQLLQRSICYVNQTYYEYQTSQICVSQPACIHFRRSNYIQRI